MAYLSLEYRLIPVQYSPPNEDAALLLGCAGNTRKKRFPDSAPSKSGTDKEVFNIQPGTSPCGVVAKEE
jgi:hypothetical protein